MMKPVDRKGALTEIIHIEFEEAVQQEQSKIKGEAGGTSSFFMSHSVAPKIPAEENVEVEKKNTQMADQSSSHPPLLPAFITLIN